MLSKRNCCRGLSLQVAICAAAPFVVLTVVGPVAAESTWALSSASSAAPPLSLSEATTALPEGLSGLRMPTCGPGVGLRLIILLPSASRRLELLGRLGHGVDVITADVELPLSELGPVDVAVLHADRLDIPCSPLLHDPKLGFPELVFVVDYAWSSELLASGAAVSAT